MRQVLYVVGPPGVGKTTLVRRLLEPNSTLTKPKWTVGPKVCAAGHYSGTTFDGADTVPYNGVQACLDYWRENLREKELTVLDGDRFSYGKVVEWWKAQGVRVRAVFLEAFEDVLEERRRLRGSNQNATWMRGRVTKAMNFCKLVPDHWRIDANNGPESVENMVRMYLTT